MKAPKLEDFGLRSETQADFDNMPVTPDEYARAFQILMDNQILEMRVAKYRIFRDQYMWSIATR